MFSKILEFFKGSSGPKEGFIKRRILIVEDSSTDRALVVSAVKKIGHEVILAENGLLGFEAAKREIPDLIISDCRMPEMDGLDMGRQLKDDPATKDIPLIYLTSIDTSKNIIDSFDIGADNYMKKPVQPRILEAQLKKIFNQQGPANP